MKTSMCPFCKGDTSVMTIDDGFGDLWYRVTCDPAKACYGSMARILFRTEAEAVSAWNKWMEGVLEDA